MSSHPPCDRVVVAFDVPIRPKPKGRPRFDPRSKRAYTDRATVRYEAAIALNCRVAMKTNPPAEGDVSALFLFERKGKRRADLDNLEKACLDAMNGIAYVDDKQVTHKEGRVVYGCELDRVSVAVIRAEAIA